MSESRRRLCFSRIAFHSSICNSLAISAHSTLPRPAFHLNFHNYLFRNSAHCCHTSTNPTRRLTSAADSSPAPHNSCTRALFPWLQRSRSTLLPGLSMAEFLGSDYVARSHGSTSRPPTLGKNSSPSLVRFPHRYRFHPVAILVSLLQPQHMRVMRMENVSLKIYVPLYIHLITTASAMAPQ